MGGLNNLKTTAQLVKDILKTDEKARNSDSYLYCVVCKTLASKKGIDLDKISMPNFLLHMNELGMPGFETVRRARQKVQHTNQELSGNDRVEAQRTLNEEIFRKFAKDKI